MTEPRTLAQAREEANDDLRGMRTSYLQEQYVLGARYLGLASVSIADELKRRQDERLARLSVAGLIDDTAWWIWLTERISAGRGLALAAAILEALAEQQDRRCVVDVEIAHGLALDEQREARTRLTDWPGRP